MFAGWNSPFAYDDLELQKCGTQKAFENWPYKDTFIKTDEEIHQKLIKIVNDVKIFYLDTLKSIITLEILK